MKDEKQLILHPSSLILAMKIGMLYSRVRAEEKLLIKEMEGRGLDFDLIDVRKIQLRLDDRSDWEKYDVVLERCVSHSRALATLQILNGWGIPTVNNAHVAEVCGSKLNTSVALQRHGVASPEVRIAYTQRAAIEAIEEMGYPVVLKPAIGSWGRLLTKVNDRESAEAILEHKETLGNYLHSIFYIQQYVEKAEGRDIRSFVVGGETICAISRTSEHWITNTARGGKSAAYPVTDIVDELSRAAAAAVGGGVVAVDLFEDVDGNWSINEVNYTMEFRNSIKPTGVNIPGKLIDYVLKVGEEKLQSRSQLNGVAYA